jgi:hypothetical protein
VTERERLGAKLSPEAKAWADRVIIPSLARQFLAQGKTEPVAPRNTRVAEFPCKTEPSAEVTL